MGVPEELTLFIKQQFNVDCFIETGTFLGGTTTWAAKHFGKVHTIEFSKELFEQTSKKYGHIENIHFYFGDTRERLTEILPDCEVSIIWLDAHWCGETSYGEDDQCPLLEELDILVNQKHDHFILIDDARLFAVPPPSPNKTSQYPDIKSIILRVSSKNWKIYIYEDVIVCVPEFAVKAMDLYLQERTTEDWKNYTKQVVLERQKKDNVSKNNRSKVFSRLKRIVGK